MAKIKKNEAENTYMRRTEKRDEGKERRARKRIEMDGKRNNAN